MKTSTPSSKERIEHILLAINKIQQYTADHTLQTFLNDNGIGTLIHYPIPPHLQDAYKFLSFAQGDFPIAEEIANTCLSLPMWPGITKNEIQLIGEHISLYCSNN